MGASGRPFGSRSRDRAARFTQIKSGHQNQQKIQSKSRAKVSGQARTDDKDLKKSTQCDAAACSSWKYITETDNTGMKPTFIPSMVLVHCWGTDEALANV